MKLLTLSSFHSVSSGSNSLSAENPVHPVTAAQTVGYIFSDTCRIVGTVSVIYGAVLGALLPFGKCTAKMPETFLLSFVGGSILIEVGERTQDYLDAKPN